MGSSLVLQGGAASAKSLRDVISQTSHGFAKGTVLRWSTSLNRYVAALADSAENSEVAGVVSDVSSDNAFEITFQGVIEGITPDPSAPNAPVLFLSSTTAGGLVSSPPSAVGTVVKPVLTKNTNGTGYLVMNYLGTQIGGSSTIAVDEIQPVGTVMPFAGSVIPDTWLECNGASYSISDYSQLYERIRNTSGVRAPMYGHVFTATTSTVNYSSGQNVTTIQGALNANTAVYLRTRPITQTQDIVARILSVSGSGNAITITAEVIPTYNSTTKNFSVPNSFLKVGGTIGSVSDPNGIFGIGTLASNGLVGQEYVTDAIVNTVNITHFNVPDLRGRFALGFNSGNIADIDGDSTLNSAIGTYGIASMGGEESHALTSGEMPAHTHNITDSGHQHEYIDAYFAENNGWKPGGNIGGMGSQMDADNGYYLRGRDGRAFLGPDRAGYVNPLTGTTTSNITLANTGSNAPHNNMPPYLAVRYIIKAKPYTRAAIIEGLDLPYSSLLVRGTVANSGDLRSRSIGGRDDDLVLYTNTSGDSGTGTERIRISGLTGNVGIGKTPNAGISLDVNGSGAFRQLGVGLSTTPTVTFDVNGTTRFTGSVGVNTASPTVALDVVGALKVSDFDGSNVLVKPRNTPTSIANIGTVGMVGQVIPLFTWNYNPYYQPRSQTAPIPFGKWFVFFHTLTDRSGASENPNGVMAAVWDVPINQYLVFSTFNRDTASTNTNSGVYYKYFTNITDITTNTITTTDVGNTPTDINTWTHMTAQSGMAVTMHGYNPSGMPAAWKGFIYQADWYTPYHIVGYTMRIG